MKTPVRGPALVLWALVTLSACSASAAAPTARSSTSPTARPTSAQNTGPPPTPAVITSLPVQSVRTTLGEVGYRSFGNGSPLLLITGVSASIDNWDPRLLSLLAQSHRVVVPDNAGVGKTSALAAPLTIDAMAQQVSAFVAALHLGKPAVLGWSMGGMIAQSLAVLHPDQVDKLVLAATQAGNGGAQPVPSAAAATVVSGTAAAVLSVLFPADQAAAERGYARSIIAYPGFYEAPASVKIQQNVAIAQWIAGKDAAGLRTSQIAVPTLVADGQDDALDPLANARQLSTVVPGAKLIDYPDAGHAFLFQDASSFGAAVATFIG